MPSLRSWTTPGFASPLWHFNIIARMRRQTNRTARKNPIKAHVTVGSGSSCPEVLGGIVVVPREISHGSILSGSRRSSAIFFESRSRIRMIFPLHVVKAFSAFKYPQKRRGSDLLENMGQRRLSLTLNCTEFFQNFPCLRASVRASFGPSVCPSVRPTLCRSVRPSIRLSLYSSVRPSDSPSASPSFLNSLCFHNLIGQDITTLWKSMLVHPFIPHQTVRLSVRPSVRPSFN